MRSLFLIPVLYCIVMRLVEVAVSNRNEARAIAAGGHRVLPDGTAPLIAVHILWFVGLLLEESFVGPQDWPNAVYISAAALAIAAEALRVSCMLTLGERWNIRVVIRPGAPLVQRGPYRFLSHPNYVAVIVLLVALPLALGLPIVAMTILPLKLLALQPRLAIENRALGYTAPGSD